VIDSNEKGSSASISKDCQSVARLPYSKPNLRVYGAVSDLTKGNSGSAADSGMMVTQMAMGMD
jgi:hypothetical protein